MNVGLIWLPHFLMLYWLWQPIKLIYYNCRDVPHKKEHKRTPRITCCGFSSGNIIKSYLHPVLWQTVAIPALDITLPAHTSSDFLIILRSWPLVNYSGCRVLTQKASQDALPVLLQCYQLVQVKPSSFSNPWVYFTHTLQFLLSGQICSTGCLSHTPTAVIKF